jgi:hypothetical protein
LCNCHTDAQNALACFGAYSENMYSMVQKIEKIVWNVLKLIKKKKQAWNGMKFLKDVKYAK